MERKSFKHLSRNDRIKMETMLNLGHTVKEISEYLHVHRSTIYREKKRGSYIHRNSDYTEEERYSSDIGQQKHDWAAEGKGRSIKIGRDIALAQFIEKKIIEDKFSPEAAIAAAKESGRTFLTIISVRTLYRYIDAGVFLNLTNKNLPVKGTRKRPFRKVRVQKRASAGESIENRPEETNKREAFGAWEMDTVKGKQKITKSCLLVLTERKTRAEVIVKLPNQKTESVVNALNGLERKWGELFPYVFKSITVDNGVEFSDCKGMESSALHSDEKRTHLYYCHPYSSWERGSNENQNRMIRRHVPKGKDFENIQEDEIEYIEEWINNYPRRIFDFQSSASLFKAELDEIIRKRLSASVRIN